MATEKPKIEDVAARVDEVLDGVGQAVNLAKATAKTVDEIEERLTSRLEALDSEVESHGIVVDELRNDAAAIARTSALIAQGTTYFVSEKPLGLYAKMAEILGEVGAIEKLGRARIEKGGQFQYEYEFVRQDDLFEAIRPKLAERGIAVFYSDEILGRDGNLTTVRVRLTLVDAETGERETMTGDAEGTDYGDKAASKAKTTAVRYLLLKTFLVASDVEPEDDNVPHERVVVETKVVADGVKADEVERALRTEARQASRPPTGRRKETLVKRVEDLAGEADEVLERDPGHTLGQISDQVQAEYGTPLADLNADELVVVGGTVREYVDLARRATTSASALDYPPGKPDFDALRNPNGTTWLNDWKGEGR